MSTTPCHRRFSKNTVVAHLQERILWWKGPLVLGQADTIDANCPPTQRELVTAVIAELEYLLDHWGLKP